MRSLAMLAGCLLLTGCEALPDGSRWGANATIAPGWQRVGDAALDAARNPWVWVPLAGAAVLQIDSWDEDVSEWARDSTPVFGSESNAMNWSDGLETASMAVFAASVLAAPSGEVDGDWFVAKAKGTSVGLGAFAATSSVTSGLKSVVSRERPDGSGDDSFPSGHASTAAVFDTLAVRNFKTIDVSPALRTTLVVGTGAITAGTAWARVEADKHYPSDVLVGVAIGNYMAAFFTEAFMGLGPESRLAFSVEPARGGAVLHVDVRF